MRTLLLGGSVLADGRKTPANVLIEDGRIAALGVDLLPAPRDTVFHLEGCFLIPGLVDAHVHLREPGFSYKETIATGTAAAARGGYTAVCAMPNLSPAPDSCAHLDMVLRPIRRDARVPVLPYGCITVSEAGEALADYAAMSADVCGFSDDGRGVQSEDVMRAAMRAIRETGRVLAAHCEVNALLRGGCIHDGDYARAHGLPGICAESEWREVARDIALAAETGCPLHICHVSTKESVALIREAKRAGIDVTCETAPHYLLLDDHDLQDDGRFKMNPPLRAPADREALLHALLDGTIDMIATDHAPHSNAEKAKGLLGSAMGVVGLETALPMLYTKLVLPGILPMETLLARMADAPRARFGLPPMRVAVGYPADLTALRETPPYAIDPATFLSKGRATPFAGTLARARVEATFCGGEPVWQSAE